MFGLFQEEMYRNIVKKARLGRLFDSRSWRICHVAWGILFAENKRKVI
jgi:hypothetical protein